MASMIDFFLLQSYGLLDCEMAGLKVVQYSGFYACEGADFLSF
jgi:hypothetical protein